MEQKNTNTDAYYEEDVISLTELFSVIWKGKIIIVITTLLVLFITIIGTKIYNEKNAQLTMVISLQWDGITDGEYPSGQLFNYKNMFQTHVLNDAVDEVKLSNISASDLRDNLVITGIVPNDVVALIEQSIKDGEKMTYYPTDFKLSLNFGALGISEEQGKKLYVELLDKFREDFEQKFIGNDIIRELSLDKLDEYDYDDIYDILSAQVNLINNTLDRNILEGSNFTSSNGYAFEDLLVISNLIQNTSLEDMLAGLESQDYIISKNTNLSKARYENQINVLQNSLIEKTTIKTELNTLITNYKGGEHIIIIPGTDIQYDTNPYLNTLYEKLVENEYEIASINAEIELLQSKITKLPTEVEKSSTDYQDSISFFEDKTVLTVNDLNDLIIDTNQAVEEYNSLVVKNAVRTLTLPNVEVPKNMVLVTAIGFVLGSMLSVGFVLIRHNYKENKQKQNIKIS